MSLPITFGGNDFRPFAIGLVLMFLPTLTTLLQLALSRSREYDADLEAARLTGDPEALASGLEALEASGSTIWERLMVPRKRALDAALLRSHPPTKERTRRLRSLALEPRPAEPWATHR